jgi:DNA-binding MarR family transcriptional regulator
VTFKRLALLAGRGARAMAALVHLTPQRFDLILHLRNGPLIQRDLASELGVVRSVVSKMVTALEKLGIVERRGVIGDRRLRLVTLTQRAFDLLRGYMRRGDFDFKRLSLQGNAEHIELQRFRKHIESAKLGVEQLSQRSQRALLGRMRAAINRTTPAQYVRFAPFDPSISHPMSTQSYWRNTRERWRPRPQERTLAARHETAGIPLDSVQRFGRNAR